MSRYISQSEARKINLANQRPKNLNIQNLTNQGPMQLSRDDTWCGKNEKIEKYQFWPIWAKLAFSTVKLVDFNFLKQSNKSKIDYLIELRLISHRNLTSPGNFRSKIISPGRISSFFGVLPFLRCACGGLGFPNHEYSSFSLSRFA